MPLGVSRSNRCDAATNAEGGLARAEMLREWAAQEPGADQYEIPNVQGSIPRACVSRRWMKGSLLTSRTSTRERAVKLWAYLHRTAATLPYWAPSSALVLRSFARSSPPGTGSLGESGFFGEAKLTLVWPVEAPSTENSTEPSIRFSLRGYRQVHRVDRPWVLPNMLAVFLSQPEEPHSHYPEDILAYLNSVPPGKGLPVSRKERVLAEWIAAGRMGPLNLPHSKQSVALLTSTKAADKRLDLKLLNERGAMLADARDEVAQMKHDLGDLLRGLRQR